MILAWASPFKLQQPTGVVSKIISFTFYTCDATQFSTVLPDVVMICIQRVVAAYLKSYRFFTLRGPCMWSLAMRYVSTCDNGVGPRTPEYSKYPTRWPRVTTWPAHSPLLNAVLAYPALITAAQRA